MLSSGLRVFPAMVIFLLFFFAGVLPGRALSTPAGFNQQSLELLALTNSDRSQKGAPKLWLNAALEESAELKCQDMINRNYFGHISPNGKDSSYFLNQAGINSFSRFAENISIGQTTDESANRVFMESPGHRQNILNPVYTEAGFAVCEYYSGNEELPPLKIVVEHFLAD